MSDVLNRDHNKLPLEFSQRKLNPRFDFLKSERILGIVTARVAEGDARVANPLQSLHDQGTVAIVKGLIATTKQCSRTFRIKNWANQLRNLVRRLALTGGTNIRLASSNRPCSIRLIHTVKAAPFATKASRFAPVGHIKSAIAKPPALTTLVEERMHTLGMLNSVGLIKAEAFIHIGPTFISFEDNRIETRSKSLREGCLALPLATP